MSQLNPDTLLEETDWERKHRQLRTGVLGEGHHVECRPDPIDRSITQAQNRTACLTRPYASCSICPHSVFTLVFKAQPDDPYDVVACPRWRDAAAKQEGESPSSYVPVEVATCRQRPFDFCTSCPTRDQVSDIGADKHRDGWYGRWKRFVSDEMEDEDE